MNLLKSLFFGLITTLSISSYAGEFSKIDYAVREEIALFFDTEYDSVKELVVGDKKEGCLITIEVNVETNTQYGEKFYRAWTCVNRVMNGSISSYIVDVFAYEEITE